MAFVMAVSFLLGISGARVPEVADSEQIMLCRLLQPFSAAGTKNMLTQLENLDFSWCKD